MHFSSSQKLKVLNPENKMKMVQYLISYQFSSPWNLRMKMAPFLTWGLRMKMAPFPTWNPRTKMAPFLTWGLRMKMAPFHICSPSSPSILEISKWRWLYSLHEVSEWRWLHSIPAAVNPEWRRLHSLHEVSEWRWLYSIPAAVDPEWRWFHSLHEDPESFQLSCYAESSWNSPKGCRREIGLFTVNF